MYALLFLAFTAFGFSLALTPIVRNLAHSGGIVDRPDQTRKLHQSPIPRLGGVAIVLSYLLAYCALSAARFTALHLVVGGLPLALRLALPIFFILTIGVLDDLRSVKPWQKFVGQFAAAGLAWLAGVHVTGFGAFSIPDWLGLPATLFWIVLCTNALNLIDGLDGLAAGVGIFATATTLLAALLQHNIDLALTVAPLLGCLLGFLRYNFNPATIFLGDSGSLVIGFFLGCCSIIWSEKSATILGMSAPLLALSIPLLDTALAVVRRFLRRKPIFGADRGHIHHRLLDRGFTPRRVALIIYGFCALFAVLALCEMYNSLQGLVIVLFCAVIGVGIQQLRFVEFGVAGRMFVKGAFRSHLNTNIALQAFESRLRAAGTPEECWHVIRESAHDFGFHAIDLSLAGRHFEHRNGGIPDQSWTVRIPLSTIDFLQLTREFEAHSEHTLVTPFADSVRRTVGSKLPAFAQVAQRGLPDNE